MDGNRKLASSIASENLIKPNICAYLNLKLKENGLDDEVEYHCYEGTWQTIFEGGVYKMLKSNIKEVTDPGVDWFYE